MTVVKSFYLYVVNFSGGKYKCDMYGNNYYTFAEIVYAYIVTFILLRPFTLGTIIKASDYIRVCHFIVSIN